MIWLAGLLIIVTTFLESPARRYPWWHHWKNLRKDKKNGQ